MCLSLRKTDRRGRSGVPKIRARVLHLRRSRRLALSFCLSAIVSSQLGGASGVFDAPVESLSYSLVLEPAVLRTAVIIVLLRACAREGLAGLDLDLFAFVTDALALVRLGLAHLADVAGELPDELLVRAGQVDLVRAFQRHRDAGGDGQRDLVGVADAEHEVLPARLGLV